MHEQGVVDVDPECELLLATHLSGLGRLQLTNQGPAAAYYDGFRGAPRSIIHRPEETGVPLTCNFGASKLRRRISSCPQRSCRSPACRRRALGVCSSAPDALRSKLQRRPGERAGWRLKKMRPGRGRNPFGEAAGPLSSHRRPICI